MSSKPMVISPTGSIMLPRLRRGSRGAQDDKIDFGDNRFICSLCRLCISSLWTTMHRQSRQQSGCGEVPCGDSECHAELHELYEVCLSWRSQHRRLLEGIEQLDCTIGISVRQHVARLRDWSLLVLRDRQAIDA